MLRLFGPHRVTGIAKPKLPRLAFLAAARLDLAPALSLPRATLAAFLWENATEIQANANLRQMLNRVRGWERATGQRAFSFDDDTISRDAGTIASDLRELLRVRRIATAEDLDRLSELASGLFLEDLPDGPEDSIFWVEEQRAVLRERFGTMALEAARRIGGPAGEAMLGRLELDAPFDDAVARAQMIVAAGHGGKAVRQAYDRFSARLARELGTDPEPGTQALLTELTQGGIAAVQRATETVAAPLAGIPKVLILPPTELAGASRAQEMLGLSLVDEITQSLARLRMFAVFAPHTARQLAGELFPQGNPYGADYVVTTRLVANGADEMRFGATLANVRTHEVLLGDEVRFAPGALSAHHFTLASAITAKLSGAIGSAERSNYSKHGSASAFVYYLLGAEIMGTFSLQSVRRARNYFQRALRLAPNFAPARSLLARSLCLEWLLLERQDTELIEASLGLAQRALEEDPLDPMAHREVGHALLYLHRLDEAVSSFESGVTLGPHHADVIFHYADGLSHAGRMAEARKAMDLALELNPLAPDFYHWVSGTTDYFLGNYGSASASLAKLKQPEPAARVIALVEAMHGNLAKAHKYRDIFLSSHPGFRLADYNIPQRRKEDREHFLEGMRRAGFT